ncbi:MAG: T9SS type A sorting domain-containing protein [Bacteroidota bacterium]
MRALCTLTFLLLGLSMGFSQNLQFTSDCNFRTFCAGAVDCGSVSIDLSIVASSDDSCSLGSNAITYTYSLTIDDDTATTENGTGNRLNRDLPFGDHVFIVYATDACTGEADSCLNVLRVQDCEAPRVSCISGTVVIPMPSVGDRVVLWAADFDLNSTDNCNDPSELTFAFSSDPTDRSEIFDCSDVTGSEINRTVHVFDQAGNSSTCDVRLLLSPCDSTVTQGTFCFEAETISGQIVENLSLINICSDDTIPAVGAGCFDRSMMGCSDLRLYKNTNWLNGVSTLDKVLMSRHVLAAESLDSPYKMISADMNKNGIISTLDMVYLHRLILYNITEVPGNTSWRFVSADFVFDSVNPFRTPFPESYRNSDLTGTSKRVIGMKVGDLNETVDPSLRVGQQPGIDLPLENRPAHSRNSDPWRLHFEDQVVEEGQIVDLLFSVSQDRQLFGIQCALDHGDGLELLEVTPQLPDMRSTDFNQVGGRLLTSWHMPQGVELSGETPLFSLRFQAKQSGRLSQLLKLDNQMLNGEVYTIDGNEIVMAPLQFASDISTSTSAPGQVQWYPSQPNPFRTETSFRVDLPKADQLRLSVYDVNGRLVHQLQGTYGKGTHHLSLTADQLSGSGLYFCELQTSQGTQLQKLILQ